MKQALRQLINDFLSAIFFFAVYSLTGSIFAGTVIAIAVGAAQFIRLKRARRPIEPMQWMSFGLVLVLGTATLVAQSPRFMMLKPSFVHFAIAAVMLRRGWMNRYLPPIVHEHVPQTAIIGAGYGWAGLMSALGVRRDKAALSSGCKPHPANCSSRKHRSNYGGNEVVEAFG
jgi:intracellular septation protein